MVPEYRRDPAHWTFEPRRYGGPVAQFAYLDHPGPLAFAHRGGAEAHPENTLAAFAHAVDLGYRYLETDVHVTSDGVALAFHDDSLDRVTDRTGRIAASTWAEIRDARVGGTERICRLDELLATFPDARFNLDPKADAAIEPIVEVLVRRRAVERVCVGSFSDRRIAELRRRCGPALAISAGPRATARARVRAAGAPIAAPDVSCYQIPVRARGVELATASFVAMAHRAQQQVHIWTIDDPAEMHRLLDLGVDGIMTDRPEVLRDVLVERGEWVAG